jgi:hypothetical protein
MGSTSEIFADKEQVSLAGEQLQLWLQDAVDSCQSVCPASRLHARVQHLFLWYASISDRRVALRYRRTHSCRSASEHVELAEAMACGHGSQLRIHHATVSIHVLWNLRSMLASISKLPEQK